jgi:hypothetical protein
MYQSESSAKENLGGEKTKQTNSLTELNAPPYQSPNLLHCTFLMKHKVSIASLYDDLYKHNKEEILRSLTASPPTHCTECFG